MTCVSILIKNLYTLRYADPGAGAGSHKNHIFSLIFINFVESQRFSTCDVVLFTG